MNNKRVILYIILVIFFTLFNFYFRPIKGNPLVTKEYKESSQYINNLYKSDEYFKKKLLKENDYYIYETLIKLSIENKKNISIPCNDSCDTKLINSYYAIYLDHPELISFIGITSYKLTNTGIEFSNYGNLGKIKTFFGVKRIEREMENIRNDTKNMTDKEKIIYVYDYVASHRYDRIFTYTKSNQSAYSFFTGGSSVCAGFAKASQLIFQNIGIKSYLVLSSSHMWNYVEYEKKYYVFDATMGASLNNKKSPYFYDGLGKTTINSTTGLYYNLYPKIETTTLKELFEL